MYKQPATIYQYELLENTHDQIAKPFLRWAGGKIWLIKYLEKFLKNKFFNNYHEPFLGSGSIFFSLNHPNVSFLSDYNKSLIDTYKTVKSNVKDVIRVLKDFKNTEQFYYKIRNLNFSSQVENAAKFIYLNQTSFNGIYRVNLNSNYNVPYGFRNKDFINENNLLIVSEKLVTAELYSGDFIKSKRNINKDDLVFLDPPYTVTHNSNGFIKYNDKLFSLSDQYRLSNYIDFLKKIGAFYILTNARHPKILELFNKDDKIYEMTRTSLVGGKNAYRGKIGEYLFTNI